MDTVGKALARNNLPKQASAAKPPPGNERPVSRPKAPSHSSLAADLKANIVIADVNIGKGCLSTGRITAKTLRAFITKSEINGSPDLVSMAAFGKLFNAGKKESTQWYQGKKAIPDAVADYVDKIKAEVQAAKCEASTAPSRPGPEGRGVKRTSPSRGSELSAPLGAGIPEKKEAGDAEPESKRRRYEEKKARLPMEEHSLIGLSRPPPEIQTDYERFIAANRRRADMPLSFGEARLLSHPDGPFTLSQAKEISEGFGIPLANLAALWDIAPGKALELADSRRLAHLEGGRYYPAVARNAKGEYEVFGPATVVIVPEGENVEAHPLPPPV